MANATVTEAGRNTPSVLPEYVAVAANTHHMPCQKHRWATRMVRNLACKFVRVTSVN